MSTSILVFIEVRDGRVHPGSLQCLTAARAVAGAAGGLVQAVVIGSDVGEAARTTAMRGADRVLVVEDAAFGHYRVLPFCRALATAIEHARPQVVLLAATITGRDLAPRAAARTGALLATDCVALALEGDELIVKRPMYSGRCVCELALRTAPLAIASIRPNAWPAPDPTDGVGAIEDLAVALSEADLSARVVNVIASGGGVRDVTEADIVVAGGRALKSEDDFRVLYELAEALDAAVGASRAAVDAGCQPHDRQIGLTGKVISPRLYLACGIDGVIQHVAGMRDSAVIVAVNPKRDAPIFDIATYGCVADLFALLPLLTAEVRRLQAEG